MFEDKFPFLTEFEVRVVMFTETEFLERLALFQTVDLQFIFNLEQEVDLCEIVRCADEANKLTRQVDDRLGALFVREISEHDLTVVRRNTTVGY